MLNKLLTIIVLSLVSLAVIAEDLSENTKRSLSNQLTEGENSTIIFLVNKYLYFSGLIPEKAILKHNAAIFDALYNPKNGILYSWSFLKKGAFSDDLIYGKLKVVLTTYDKRGICRKWIEEVGLLKNKKHKKFSKQYVMEACFDENAGNFILVDELFYENM